MKTFCTRCHLPIVFTDNSRWEVDWSVVKPGSTQLDDSLMWCAYGDHSPRPLSRQRVLVDLVRVVMG